MIIFCIYIVLSILNYMLIEKIIKMDDSFIREHKISKRDVETMKLITSLTWPLTLIFILFVPSGKR